MKQLDLGIAPAITTPQHIASRNTPRPARWIGGGGARCAGLLHICSQRGLSTLVFSAGGRAFTA